MKRRPATGRRVATLLALCALAGCVSVPKQRIAPPAVLSGQAQDAAMSRQQSHERRMQAFPTLSFAGRVALANGREGGNGRIEWRQTADRYEVVLSAPVTRQSWKLSGDGNSARIDGIAGGPREGTDVVALLKESTGLEIPVGALAAWAAGTRADPSAFGSATLQFDADGVLSRIEQGGWTIDYPGWQDVVATAGDEPIRLPSRVDAVRGQAKVRLAIDAWTLSP